ncbi:sodium/bile acid cotransporter 7-like [Belonocnema kinseyi]|uniref:sodium/bile acid cotransporter 7-like n=1 Tax=Belonocnema kinseyi TaxID=2817044 RepID=UPI00143DD5EE|nr:sodium/bile acid cotransporter 7-like [Belonocnema kinseyi]XP_033221712.1 sodium/bile acid cotransporter 7-like [Belonocnema kinseyi]
MRKKKNGKELVHRYGFFMLMLLCILFASLSSKFGGAKGKINGNIVIWYFAVPLTYFEAGLSCSPKALYSSLTDGYLLIYLILFMYLLMPLLARISSCILTYVQVNIWLLKGMEVLYCMPPPFSTSLVLSRVAHADLPTSVITTLVSHFVGLFLSPIVLYFMLGASTPPLVGINIKEILYSTLLPLGFGITVQMSFISNSEDFEHKFRWLSQGLLLLTAYHWFCDAVVIEASSLQAVDVLLCVLIACLGQILITSICWILCSQWLPRNVLLAALFTSTHKSVGLGGWLLRGAYHGSVQGPAISLPLSVLPVAQLLLGTLLASFLAP